MPEIGDRVAIAGNKVGQAPREGTVRARTGNLMRIEWDSGEESTVMPAPGTLTVLPKGRGRKAPARKVAAKKPAPARKAAATKKPAPVTKAASTRKPAPARKAAAKQPAPVKKAVAKKPAPVKKPAAVKKPAPARKTAAKKR